MRGGRDQRPRPSRRHHARSPPRSMNEARASATLQHLLPQGVVPDRAAPTDIGGHQPRRAFDARLPRSTATRASSDRAANGHTRRPGAPARRSSHRSSTPASCEASNRIVITPVFPAQSDANAWLPRGRAIHLPHFGEFACARIVTRCTDCLEGPAADPGGETSPTRRLT